MAKRLKIEENIEAGRQPFERVAREWHENAKSQWAKIHAADIIRSLERYVFPSIGALPVGQLTCGAAVAMRCHSSPRVGRSRPFSSSKRGALLLPKGGLEISPGIAFNHTQTQGLVLMDTPEGISTVSDQRSRSDGLEFAATARYGLPWRSQIQVRVPFGWRRQASALGDGTEISNHETQLGDVEVELAHQFLVEKGGWPALIGGVSWRLPTGSDPFRTSVASIASGGGTHQVTARATVLKTFDPLVVFSTVSYSANLSRNEEFGRIHPGDSVAWQLGGLLAVSPETSLNAGFAQQFKLRTTVDGSPILGSDGIAAVGQFGISQVLSASTLLDISVGVGVTRDAPDYQLIISLPIRLN